MATFFVFRAALTNSRFTEEECELIKLDAALLYRVNERSRTADNPS